MHDYGSKDIPQLNPTSSFPMYCLSIALWFTLQTMGGRFTISDKFKTNGNLRRHYWFYCSRKFHKVTKKISSIDENQINFPDSEKFQHKGSVPHAWEPLQPARMIFNWSFLDNFKPQEDVSLSTSYVPPRFTNLRVDSQARLKTAYNHGKKWHQIRSYIVSIHHCRKHYTHAEL